MELQCGQSLPLQSFPPQKQSVPDMTAFGTDISSFIGTEFVSSVLPQSIVIKKAINVYLSCFTPNQALKKILAHRIPNHTKELMILT